MKWPLLIPCTLVVALACIKSEDDEGMGDDESSDMSPTESETDSELPTCDEAVAEFASFVNANKSCASDDDCQLAGAFCYPAATCGSVAINEAHDADMRSALHEQIELACGEESCGADPCGAQVACTGGVCNASL